MDVWLTDHIGFTIPPVSITDLIEIAIIAAFIYAILVWIKNTRAWMLFRGIIVIALFFVMAAAFQMTTILWLGAKLLNAGLIALIVVFQPELRHALEQLGRRNIIFAFFAGLGRDTAVRFDDHTIVDLVKACYEMGAVKTGALIVVEQDVQLAEYERTGIAVDAVLTKQLLINIFEKNTPLHDGAVIVRGDRIVSATCYLPLSENMSISKDLGTRHRAALGVSEVSDALTIIVSEETGKVSIARDGRIQRDISMSGLEDILRHIQKNESAKRIRRSDRYRFFRRRTTGDGK
ncbi:MAG: diadenylate cyclase CdaA [Lachnospiraceae bacterium]|nr:diadenylate cyclase CdaA [Lachnospiraceae bacterium]